MLEDLYQEVILESAQSTHNRGSLSDTTSALSELVHNPLCGDTVELWLDIDGEKIKTAKFSGSGCAISQAAASLLTDLLNGSDLPSAVALVEDFQQLLSGNDEAAIRERLGSLAALEGVRKFPARMRCALLAFEAFQRLMDKRAAEHCKLSSR